MVVPISLQLIDFWTSAELQHAGPIAGVMLRHRDQLGYRECLSLLFFRHREGDVDIFDMCGCCVVMILCWHHVLEYRWARNNSDLMTLRTVLQRGNPTKEELTEICKLWNNTQRAYDLTESIHLAIEFEQYDLVELMELYQQK